MEHSVLSPTLRHCTARSIVTAGLVAAFLSAPASAQGIADLLPSQIAVGGYAVAGPKYEGSKQYRALGFPIALPAGAGAGGGLIQFRGVDDVRLRLLNTNGFELGPVLGWRFGRSEDAADRLRGLGDVDGGLVVGGYAGYRFGNIKPFVAYLHQVTGDDTGGLVRFGVESTFVVAQGVTVLATLGANYADKNYMGSFFTVTGAQSASSAAGLPVYGAGAGLKDAYLSLSTSVPLTDRWSLMLSGSYKRLIGDAADSPIVETPNQLSGGIGLTYRFNLR
jgi:outer membrane protein